LKLAKRNKNLTNCGIFYDQIYKVCIVGIKAEEETCSNRVHLNALSE